MTGTSSHQLLRRAHTDAQVFSSLTTLQKRLTKLSACEFSWRCNQMLQFLQGLYFHYNVRWHLSEASRCCCRGKWTQRIEIRRGCDAFQHVCLCSICTFNIIYVRVLPTIRTRPAQRRNTKDISTVTGVCLCSSCTLWEIEFPCHFFIPKETLSHTIICPSMFLTKLFTLQTINVFWQ